ncbi:MAG TPA: 2-phospho-L-lactate transferase [Anaerolineaceae bacterium]
MKITALAGGVGGAKLADGLARCLAPGDLTIIVNTGDDFEHFGLRISPDLDTVCYTLAGIANPQTGWGRQGETWTAMESLRRLGAPDWFNLGDGDLATHLERTRRLRAGESLSQVTAAFCRAWGIPQLVLPMSDQPVETFVETRDEGSLAFQEYFVHRRCEPEVTGFRFVGIEAAQPAPGVLESIRAADAVVICPSNPWVSIGPITALNGVEQALREKFTLAVSPLIGGQAVKGPAAKMYRDLGIQPTAKAVANSYRGFVSAFMIDRVDHAEAEEIQRWGIMTVTTDIIMSSPEDRRRLGREVLAICEQH